MRQMVTAVAVSLAVSLVGSAHAAEGVIRIGLMNDQTGPFADLMGPGSVVSAKLAIEDHHGKAAGLPIELRIADHQNKPDLGSALARQWFAEGVDVIIDVPNSAVALAVNAVARQANKVMLTSGANTNRLTDDSCSPNTIQWTIDSWAIAKTTGTEVVNEGGKKWYFLTADYAFGHDVEAQVSAILRKSGATILGSVKHPINSNDFSSYLIQAQAAKPDVLALATSGSDAVNALKQASEFQLGSQGIRLVGLALYLSDIHSLGIQTAQGMYLSEPYYWDLNDQTRAFATRFAERFQNRKPTAYQASVYSAVTHYLKAVTAMNGEKSDGAAVVRKMKELPTDDPIFGRGSVRIDGRKMHPMYLFQVKSPAESKAPWDYYKVVRKVPAEEAWRPLSEEKCELIKG
jgi:branched-chain amino acid transport system substrate-binding protein